MAPPKVSIIIPVYNAGKYIEKCACSLFAQTLDSIEYIFVDDSSPDNSISILSKVLEDYPNRKEYVRIIRHNKNEGVGRTRQDGIDAATGEYIIHCDPDDWADLDMYEALYNKAKETEADIVICDYYEEYEDKSVLKYQDPAKDKRQLFKQIPTKEIHCSFCNKMIKSSLAKKYPIEADVNMCEDRSIVSCLLIEAQMIEKVDGGFYHYFRNNAESMSNSDSVRNAISKIKAFESMYKRFVENGLIDKVDKNDMYCLQLASKRGLLSDPTRENINLWLKTFPMSNAYYKKMHLSVKDYILVFLAVHKCYWIMRCFKNIKDLIH